MRTWGTFLVAAVLAYTAGSLPFSLWITRWRTGQDLRQGGSGHAGATNTFRLAGLGPGLVVLALDLMKGALPVLLARVLSLPDAGVAAVAGLVVLGHCWPFLAGFQGGMGLATAGGVMLAISPLGFTISLGVLVAFVLALRHTARAVVVGALLAAPVLWLLGQSPQAVWAAGVMGMVLAIRFSTDWNRVYRELWLDRENH